MQEVHVRSGESGEHAIARNDHGFRSRRTPRDAEATRPLPFVHVAAVGEARIFGVLGDDGAREGLRVLERAAHHARLGDTRRRR